MKWSIWGTDSNLLIERVGQGLHGSDGHHAMVSCGEQGALPHVVLPRVPHHQEVILLERQLLLILVIVGSGEQRLSKAGSWKETDF